MSVARKAILNRRGLTLVSVTLAGAILLVCVFCVSLGMQYALQLQNQAETQGLVYDLERYLDLKMDCPTTVANLTSCNGQVIPIWKAKGASCEPIAALRSDNTMVAGSVKFRAKCMSFDSANARYRIEVERQSGSGSWEPLRIRSTSPRAIFCPAKELVFKNGWQAGMYLWGTGRLVGSNLPGPGKVAGIRRGHPQTLQELCNIFGRIPANTPGYEGDGRFASPFNNELHWWDATTSTWTKSPADQAPVNNMLWEGSSNPSIELRCVLAAAKTCP